jgi:hypothetical protein
MCSQYDRMTVEIHRIFMEYQKKRRLPQIIQLQIMKLETKTVRSYSDSPKQQLTVNGPTN